MSYYEISDFRGATLVELLRFRAINYPDRIAYRFLEDGEHAELAVTYAELDRQARAVAARLQQLDAAGERALLLYPPGLDYIATFFGCLYAGVIAVPAYPPRLNRPSPRIQGMVADAEATIALATTSILENIERRFEHMPDLVALKWLNTEGMSLDIADEWQEPTVSAETLAFLQYTSGSTSAPKGVMVTHGNLIHNLKVIHHGFQIVDGVGVFWLPSYHDMGLIGGVLEPMFCNGPSILMSPAAFLQRPVRWLEAISNYKGTISGAPNFAYQMCVDKITDEQMAALDLSSWGLAFSGAEPIRHETMAAFARRFAAVGFRRDAFYPCYGLAEGTLLVSGGFGSAEINSATFDLAQLAQNKAITADPEQPGSQTMVSCGRSILDQEVVIVDPETLNACPPGKVGEIWVSGDSVAQGYWGREAQSQATFRAMIADSGKGPFLRTGDLGFFHEEELYITGRLKDLIIIRGRNHYPQDIEQTVEASHEAFEPSMGAAFSIDVDGEEQLVVTCEAARKRRKADIEELAAAARRAVAENHQLRLYALVLLKPMSIPKTSSGKVKRHACRLGYLDGSLNVINQWHSDDLSQEPAPAPIVETAVQTTTADLQSHRERTAIESWLIERVAALLKLAPGRVDVREPFAYYGLDSAQAVELAGDLENWLGRSLSPTLVWDYPNIAELSAHLAGVEPAALAEPAEAAAPAAPAEADPIVVVGLSCRFPGAEDPDAFWRNLSQGIDSIAEVPADRWNLADFYDETGKRGKMTTRWGGFLSDIDQFDPNFFGISPREASRMDPQQRLLLEVTWEALENAGIHPDELAGSRTGVFVGISSYDYSHLQFSSADLVDAYAGTGNAHSIAANRLSYVLDLQGPSMALDTACSSSLVAIHQAIRSLRSGESDMALAGGVNLLLSPELTVAFSQARMMAADGHCKTFDAQADGYVRGEGCGVIVLKRLSDAERDGDTVLAVLMGSAVNQDGRSNGLTAPNGRSQQAVIRQALKDAGVEPDAIDYIEAHGTGTPLGDPIEIQSLRAVLDGAGDGRIRYVGSVKTNIGHLESAAGIAGLIKVILALRHGYIPPHLNYAELNPYIDLTNSALQIVKDGAPWSAGERIRIAGVSSFGFGGTNAHVVIGDYVETAEPQPIAINPDDDVERPLHLLPLSAKSENALRGLAGRYADYFQNHSDISLADVAYSAYTSRKQFDYRLAVSGADGAALQDKLTAIASGKTAVPKPGRKNEKVAFLFTGQGAQFAGMGWELFETQPVFREALMRCAEILDAYLERPLLEIMFAEPDSRAAEWLDRTEYTQPALFALEYSLAQLWFSWGVQPDAVMGHSVGEYVAACLAGVFSLEDGLKLISARSQLMGSLPTQEGAMVAVFAPESVVLESISAVGGVTNGSMIGVAAINGPQSVVISGERVAVKKAMGYLGERGVETRPLVVSHAFHSPLMDPILDLFEEVAEQITYHAPQIPLISNLDGSLMENAPDARYWREHIRRPVYFADGMQNLYDQGIRAFLEVGPQPHLLGMGRRCLAKAEAETPLTWLPSLRPPKDDWQTMLDSLGRLYEAGFDIDWAGFDDPYTRRKVSLPTYAFDRERYWLEVDQKSSPVASGAGSRPFGETIYAETGMEVVRLATAVPLFEAVLDKRPKDDWTTAYNRALAAIGNNIWGGGDHQTSVMVAVSDTDTAQRRVQISLTLLSEGVAVAQLFRQQDNGWQVIGSGQLSRGQSDSQQTQQIEQPEAVEESAENILAFLSAQASAALGLPLDRLPHDQPLDSLGMDSLMAIEMRSAIERQLRVSLPVVEFLQGPTLNQLAERVEALLSDGAGLDAIPTYEGSGPHPLTHSQQAMWFLHELLPDEVSLNVSGAVRLTGPLDTAALHNALASVVERHPALRTTYTLVDGIPVQEATGDFANRPTGKPNRFFYEVDAAGWDEAKTAAYLQREAHRPFDLEHGPLIRLVVLRRSAEEHILLLSVNHIAADFWSMSVIVQELYGLYAAEIGDIDALSLPELPVSYTDYARWNRDGLEGEEGQRLQQYWLEQLSGELPLLDLPTDHPRPAAQRFDGRMAHLVLPEGLSQKLQALSHEHGATLYMTLLAAFQTLLHRYSGQDDLLVGSVLAGRDRPELAGLVGYFINPVAMRANFKDDPSFIDLLTQARETVLGAYDHQEYPLPLLADQLQFKRDPGRPPVFETMFIMQRAGADALGDNLNALALGLPGAKIELGSLTAESLPLDNLPAQFDLTLMMTEVEAGLAAALHYNTALFNEETAERMLAHLQTLLLGLVEQPERPLSAIPLLPADERQRLLVDWNDAAADYPADKAFFQLFEEQAAWTPDKTAVLDPNQSYTYQALNERANRLAHYLQAQGVGRETLVGVALERSADMLVALLGVHKAGGAYIPLDPAFPESRLAMMLEDAQPAVLLTQSSLLEGGDLSWLNGQTHAVCLDGDWADIEPHSAENPAPTAEPHALAYIIYTSGSTGKPKGVQISQQALLNFLTTMAERPGLTAEDTLLAVTTLSFDIAGLELFLPLMVGATIVIAERETAVDGHQLQQLMDERNVTVMQATPATWQLLLAANWPGKNNLKILSGGESLPAELASALLSRSAELWNVYGPTETTIWSTVHKVEAADSAESGRAVSIGRPIGNTDIYILDRQMQPVPVGVVGDLYIGGDGLARGYYQRFGLTAERFIPSPFKAGERLYLTGDLARYLPNGNIIFLGRNDFQVKIRGYRIELGDIEAALDALPTVAQAVVAAKADSRGEQRLVAYLVGKSDLELPPVEELRASLAETLPGYMIPAVFVVLDAFPLTPNGKVDRKALPESEMERSQITAEYVAPCTPLEQELADLCATVLGLEKVGIHDSFFDLGGNSLMATRLISKVREIAGGPVSLRLLFAEPTVAGLARAIEASRDTEQNGRESDGLFEEKTVEELLAEAVLDPTITANGRTYRPTAEPENILLTGATGFVGAFLLRDLLLETDATVYCLVRAADEKAGWRRLENNLSRYGIWQSDFYDRIVPVLGDLGQPSLGLTAEQFAELAETVEVIYHNGAMVNFVYPYESHKASNVQGTEEILRLATMDDLKPVHFVSTLSVFHTGHHNDGTIFAEQDDLEQVGVPFGGYAQSKWIAEKMVMTAVQRGIPAAIYRPGLVSGDSQTGAWNTGDMMTTLARASLAIGAVPELDVQVDIVPVDYVSGAIVALSRRPQTIGGIFHLANTGPMPFGDLLEWVETQGMTLEQVPFIEWRQRLADLMTAVGGDEVAAFAPLLEEVTAEQIFMPAINCANTLAGLQGSHIACPPVDGRLIATYFGYLMGESVK